MINVQTETFSLLVISGINLHILNNIYYYIIIYIK